MSIEPVALSILESTPRVLRAFFASMPADAALLPVDAGWSPRDALAHMVDTEQGVLAERVRRMIEEERPFIRSIDATARLAESGFHERSVGSLLDELYGLREGHVAWLRGLTGDQLARAGKHDEAGEITASGVAHQWAYHDLMHLKQIATMLQASLVAHMGNTRKFYDV
jgi:hypothetical protein